LGVACDVELFTLAFAPAPKVNRIFVEQNVPATLKTVDRALILKSSRVVFEGPSSELASHPDLWAWF
jgi:branched-chain amino acid transport system ATP-binding protein